VTFDPATHVATVTPLFYDEAQATLANAGQGQGTTVRLALTDPDSNEMVPFLAPRIAEPVDRAGQCSACDRDHP